MNRASESPGPPNLALSIIPRRGWDLVRVTCDECGGWVETGDNSYKDDHAEIAYRLRFSFAAHGSHLPDCSGVA